MAALKTGTPVAVDSETPRLARALPVTAIAHGAGRQLSGQALIDDMRKYRERVTATPESARQFLMDLGVLTKSGKPKTLIRG